MLFVGDVSNDANDYTLFFLAALLLLVMFCSDLYYCFAYHYYDQVSLLSLLKLFTLNVILHFCRFSYYDADNFKEGLEQHLLMDLSTDVPNTCAMINKVTFGILMIMIKYFYDH